LEFGKGDSLFVSAANVKRNENELDELVWSDINDKEVKRTTTEAQVIALS